MGSFHLASRVLVLLPGGFPYRLTVEGELVPVDLSAFVDSHFVLLTFPCFVTRLPLSSSVFCAPIPDESSTGGSNLCCVLMSPRTEIGRAHVELQSLRHL